jgi:DNA-binding NarL/FixJ family response regulator
VGSADLVGRDDALRILSSMTTALEAGTGGAVLVSGEHGIGKTELLRAAFTDGASYDLTWAQSPGAFRAVADEILAGGAVPAPLAVVAEDLHRADEATVLVWYRLSRAASQLPLLLAGSLRPGNGRPDLARLRRGLVTRRGTVIELGPLTRAEIGTIARETLGAPLGRHLAGLLAWAGGNPRYARTLAQGLADDGRIRIYDGVAELADGPGSAEPRSVRLPGAAVAAAGERLADLGAEVTEALRWAAVLGTEFPATDLAVVTGSQAERLMGIIGEALEAGVIADAGHTLLFRHDLIRRALYEQIPAGLRGGLHAQAARALASGGAAPERIAAQFLLAAPAPGEQPWALDWLTRNALVLASRSPEVAAQLLRSALSRLDPGDSRRAQLRRGMLTALLLAGLDDEIDRIGRELLATTADPDLNWLVGYSMVRAGRPADAAAILEQARAGPVPSPLQDARLRALHANVLALLGDGVADGRAAGEARAALAAPGADPLARGLARHVLALLSDLDRDSHGRLDHIDQGLADVGHDSRFADLRLLLLADRVNALDVLDRREEALAVPDQGGWDTAPRAAWIRVMLALARYTAGSWDDALAETERVTGAPCPDDIRWHAHAVAALILGHRGQTAAAAGHLSEVPSAAERPVLTAPGGQATVILARALAAQQRAGPDDGLAVLRTCLEPDRARLLSARQALLPHLARLAVMTGEAGLARAAAAAAGDEARRDPLRWKLAAAKHCAGLAAADPYAVVAAADYARTAGRVLESGQALEDAAVLAAVSGDAAAARRLAADAVRQYSRLGAEWDISRATERLRPHGIRLANLSPAGDPDFEGAGLTRMEERVASLVARGMSNPEIAARLSVSRNTVQTHVSHILNKLGVRSRRDICLPPRSWPLR